MGRWFVFTQRGGVGPVRGGKKLKLDGKEASTVGGRLSSRGPLLKDTVPEGAEKRDAK